jgi:hypothetical protein
MRTLLTIALLFAAPAEAVAACHHYSNWRYPWPQRCYAAAASAPLRRRADQQSHDWSVEIVKLPPSWNLDEPTPTPPAPPPGLCCIGEDFVAHPPGLTDEERRARALLRMKQEQPK